MRRTPDAPIQSRVDALDWLRGAALILIVMSHGWALWAFEQFESIPALHNAMQSGNVGVTVFLVVAGFLLTRSLIGRRGTTLDDSGAVGPIEVAQPVRAVVSRLIRLSSQVYPLLFAVLVVNALDPKDAVSFEHSQQSSFAVATYTWNWYLQDASPIARPDFGHLWYTAVYMQVTVFLVLLIWSLRRRRVVLALVVLALIVACALWRQHVVVSEGDFFSLLRTTTRMDGMLWGALLALCWPWLGTLRSHGGTLAGWGLLGYGVLVLTVGNSTSYMSWAGIAANLFVVLFVLGSSGLPHGALHSLLTRGPLVWLGRHSLSLYVWHYPVFFFVARHFGELSGVVKGVLASVLVIALATLTTRLVERPVARLMSSSRGRTEPTDADLHEISSVTSPTAR